MRPHDRVPDPLDEHPGPHASTPDSPTPWAELDAWRIDAGEWDESYPDDTRNPAAVQARRVLALFAELGALQLQRDEIRANRDALALQVAEQRGVIAQLRRTRPDRDMAAAHEALRAEIASTSIHHAHITGLLRAAEVIGVPPADGSE